MRRPKTLIAGCVLVVITIALLIQHTTITSRTDARLAKLQDDGLPVTLAELNRSYTLPQGATNAADFYMPAFASLTGNHASNTNAPIANNTKLGDPYPTNSIAFMRKWIANNEHTIKLLHQGAQYPACRYPFDYSAEVNFISPHAENQKQCVLLLTYDAWLRAESNDLDDAIHSLESAMSLIDSRTKEPDWIAVLLRTAGHAIVIHRLEEIMNRHDLNDSQLSRLQRLFEVRESPGNLRPAFASSLCRGVSFFENPIPVDAMGQLTTLTKGERIKASFARAANIATGLWARDRDFYVDVVGRCIDAAGKPFPDALREIESIEVFVSSEAIKPGRQTSRMLMTGISRGVIKEARRFAMLRVAQTAIAIERYRLAHDDALPDALGHLVPKFLPEIPDDPFDGKPLRYRPLDPGYVIYSISTDLQDDGGDPSATIGEKDDRFRMLR